MRNARAILKGEEGVHAECQLIFVATVEDRLVRVVVANFRSDQQLREELVFRERLDGHARRKLVVVGADGRTVGEAVGGVIIPLQPGIEREARIECVTDVAGHPPPTACRRFLSREFEQHRRSQCPRPGSTFQ